MNYPQQGISTGASAYAQQMAAGLQNCENNAAQPHLKRLQDDLARLTETASHARGRVRSIADRLLGPTPMEAGGSKGEPPSCGAVQEMSRRLQDLGMIIAMLHDEIGRLETL